MKRSLKIPLERNADLESTISEYNKACNEIINYGFAQHTWNKNKLHLATYYEIRKKYPNLQSSLVCCARDHASNMLKQCKAKTLPVKSNDSAIKYNVRTISVNLEKQTISVSTINGRKKITFKLPDCYEKYKVWKSQYANIGIKKGKMYLFLVVETETPEKHNGNILGIDRGIINPIVSSDNQFFNSKEIRRIKGQYQYLRSRLQAKGTPSAKRKLKRISGKEQRFVRNVNHKLAKQIANSDADVFALEELKVKKDKKKGRQFNKLLGKWSHAQFQSFLEYKAEELGKSVLLVNSRYTSQTCSICGHRERANRKGRNFKCLKCGFGLNADLNAARYIAKLGKALLMQTDVNQPIVASNDMKPRNFNEDSYKPLISIGGC
ncbi:MAG: transposase [Candidatus Micrarchaeota archaeon]